MNKLEALHPVTLSGLKRLAKHRSKHDGIALTTAQNLVAKTLGFRNYHYARSAFNIKKLKLHPIEIRHRWEDDQTGAKGIETLIFCLYASLTELPIKRVGSLPRCEGMRRGSNKFIARYPASSRDSARMLASQIARTLQFVDASGLIPAHVRPSQELSRKANYHGVDHETFWQDPDTGFVLMVDEPYEVVAAKKEDEQNTERYKFCSTHGLDYEIPEWSGIYFPEGGCGCYLVSEQGYRKFLDLILKRLADYMPVITTANGNFISSD
ncbi:MAG: hypothetical protein JKY50_19125 [Oleispira sp.]|nr:hypothetical protein [Oleispira sp.]